MPLKYTPHTPFSLAKSDDFDENWLQELIAKNPYILGIEDVELVQRERRQERAGRLDILLYDRTRDRRYEV